MIDGGLRLDRAQTQLIDTFARLLDAEPAVRHRSQLTQPVSRHASARVSLLGV